ncbi:17812_t:CDS:1 [Cetraspora pellucida]|uniref:17812_t:CDS:1 n=1 Tax=Cetraspora pellucida TaxID=1433469 RepID=A0ACA9NL64_9GLOM|nr:17812_t:CDS:1 [Cetraspora pellucida]
MEDPHHEWTINLPENIVVGECNIGTKCSFDKVYEGDNDVDAVLAIGLDTSVHVDANDFVKAGVNNIVNVGANNFVNADVIFGVNSIVNVDANNFVNAGVNFDVNDVVNTGAGTDMNVGVNVGMNSVVDTDIYICVIETENVNVITIEKS